MFLPLHAVVYRWCCKFKRRDGARDDSAAFHNANAGSSRRLSLSLEEMFKSRIMRIRGVVTLPPLFQMGISENVHSSINKQQWNQHRYDLFNLLVDNIPPLTLYDSANESLVSLLVIDLASCFSRVSIGSWYEAITKWKYLDIPRAPNRQCVKKADCFDVLPFYYYLVAQRSALEEPLIQMLILICNMFRMQTNWEHFDQGTKIKTSQVRATTRFPSATVAMVACLYISDRISRLL